MGALQALSTTTLEIHRRCQHLSPAEFMQLCWATLQACIPFKSGYWMHGDIAAPLRIHAHSYHCDAQVAGDVVALLTAEPFSRASAHDPCVANTYDCVGIGSPPAARFARRWRLRYALMAHVGEPTTRLTSNIVLLRASSAKPFNRDEQQLLRGLAPHLVETQGVNRLVHLASGQQHRQIHACAIADLHGYLRVAPAQFEQLVLLEFPDWHGPLLPPELARALFFGTQSTVRSFRGAHTFVRATPTSDTYLLQARRRRPIDDLTARELQVAHLCARGGSYREIAKHLGIAQATARNYLAAILRKLNAAKRGEVVAHLADLE